LENLYVSAALEYKNFSPRELCHDLKKHKPWADEGCAELLDLSKRAKLQGLQDPRELNLDNLKADILGI
jgi:hypothetical protein